MNRKPPIATWLDMTLPLARNLVFLWPLLSPVDSNTAYDVSGRGNHGTLSYSGSGNDTSWVSTPYGLAAFLLDSDGGGYGGYVDGPILASGTYSFLIILREDNTADNNYLIDARAGGGSGYCYINKAGAALVASNGTTYVDGLATTAFPAGLYHHVVISGISLNAPSVLRVGAYNDARQAYRHKGPLLYVALFEGTLAAAQVSQLYQEWFGLLDTEDDPHCDIGAGASPSVSPSASVSASISASVSASPSASPSASASYHTPSPSPSASPSASASYHTPSPSPSASPSASASYHTPSPSPSASPSASASYHTPSPSPSASPSASASYHTPSPSPSASPSASASYHTPSPSPSASPSTASISASPSASVSVSPSISKSASISVSPSVSPSISKSASPSISPSISVSLSPSVSPSISPSASPSVSPSASASFHSPSVSPSVSPSASISASPSTSVSASGVGVNVMSVRLTTRQGHGVQRHMEFKTIERPAGSTVTVTGA